MKRVPIVTLLTVAMLVTAFVAYAVTFRVRFSEVAVRVRLGKADESSIIREPGIYLFTPLIESVKVYDRRVRVLETPEVEMKTRDGKNLIVGMYALWQIENPLQYYVRSAEDEKARSQLRDRLNEVRATVIGRHDLSELFSLDPEQVAANHMKLEAEILEAAAPGILQDYGIKLVAVGIPRYSFPETVNTKVAETMVQEREAIAAAFRKEGEAKAEAIKARANAAKATILEFAKNKAKQIENEGVEASQRIIAQIKPADREFYIWLRWMDALRASLREKSTIFFENDSELIQRFMSPTIRGAAPAAGSSASAGGAVPATDGGD